MLKLRRVWDPEGSCLTYRYSLRPVNSALRLDPPDEMVVVVGEPDRAVVEVNRVAAAAVPMRDDAVRACVDLRQWKTYVVHTYPAPGAPGFTRLNWDLRPTKDVSFEYGGDDPKGLLPAGDYTAELSFGSLKMKQNFHVDLAEGITPR